MNIFQSFAVYIILAGGVLSCHRKPIKEQSSLLSYVIIDSLVQKDSDAALKKLETLSNTPNPTYYFYKGYALLLKNEIVPAEFELEKALQLLSSQDSLRPRVLYQLAKIKKLQGNFKESQACLTQVLSSQTTTPKLMAEANVLLGIVSKAQSDYSSAISFYSKALDHFIQSKDSVNIGLTYHNIGVLYYQMNQNKTSIEWANKSTEIKTALKDELGTLRTLNLLAENYKELKQFDQSIELQDKIIEQLILHKDSVELAYSYLSLGDVYRNQKEYHKSNEYILKSLHLFKEHNDLVLQFEAYKALVALYFEKTGTKEGVYFESLMQLGDSLKILNAGNVEQETEQKVNTLLAIKQAEVDKSNFQKVVVEKRLLQIQYVLTILVGLILLVILYNLYRRYKRYVAEKDLENKLLLADLEKVKVSEKEALERLIVLGQGMVENKDIFDQVLQALDAAKKTGSINTKEIELSIKNRSEKIDDREVFVYYLQRVQDGFMQKIKNKYPLLTETEIKVCGLLSLDLNSKKIASLLNVEPKSVRIYQYRIRKKLGLSGDDNLTEYFSSI